MKPHHIVPLISIEEIQTKVRELGQDINEHFAQSHKLVIISLLRGAMVFTADLCRQLRGNIILDVMNVSSYGDSLESSKQLTIHQDLAYDIEGCDVLLIDDLIDTGHTLKKLLRYLEQKNPAQIKLCTLLSKPDCLEEDISVDFVGFNIPDEFVVGYGIDYAYHYRHLPYVARVVLE